MEEQCSTVGCGFLAGHRPPCQNETLGEYPKVVQAEADLAFDIDSALRTLRSHPMFYHDKDTSQLIISLPDGDKSAEWRKVVTEILPDVLFRYHSKSVDYAGTTRDLGPRGQFSDMWRKLKKLKKSLWDGESLVGEQPDEIIDDLIAHCLLIKLDMKDGVE